MIVYIRLCSIPSTNPSPIYQDDKFELNKLCLKSFVNTFKEIKPEVVFLADFCGERESEMVDQIMKKSGMMYSFIATSLGINDTCLLQYEMASKQDDDLIFFLECDYLWNPAIDAKIFVEAIKTLGLVSPYDHPNFYDNSFRDLHSSACNIELVSGYHFRSTERNTMTFGLRRDILVNNLGIFNKYGYLDGDVWYDLLAAGQKLYVPIPTMATHMVTSSLAPGVDWAKVWSQ